MVVVGNDVLQRWFPFVGNFRFFRGLGVAWDPKAAPHPPDGGWGVPTPIERAAIRMSVEGVEGDPLKRQR